MSHAGPTASRTADRRATSSATCGRPTLILAPPNPFALAASASSTSAFGSMCSQPPSVVYSGHGCLGAAGHDVQRQLRARQRRSHSAVSIAASASEVIAPTVVAWVENSRSRQIASIVLGVASDQARREVVAQQRHDRRTAGADGVAVAGADRAVAVEHANDRRFLRHEALDRVGALDLGLEVDEHELDALDDRHRMPLRRCLARQAAAEAVGRRDQRPRATPGSRAE